jgi:7-cyano-7-deazaguanine synthase in queuosine biosynthesis
MKPEHSRRPEASIVFLGPTERGQISGKARRVECRLGTDLRTNVDVLSAYLLRAPDPKILDLVRIVGCVAHADRRVSRSPFVCWGRDLSLAIPVYDPDFWAETSVTLRYTLDLLTGDAWHFEFRGDTRDSRSPRIEPLKLETGFAPAMAFSNGLDSFAVSELYAAGALPEVPADSRRELILVTTGRKRHADRQWKQVGRSQRRQVAVPFELPQKDRGYRLGESSFRSRGFVFQAMAAIAAAQSESDLVVVAESGQGSLGPWLAPVGCEAPDLRCHPLFTSALSVLLKPILARTIRFEHPQLWSTKGATLRKLKREGLAEGWDRTHSCSRQARHQKRGSRRLHCGICPNCVLRRQSALAAELADREDAYGEAATLEQFGGDGFDRSLHKRLIERAAIGFMPGAQLARFLDGPFTASIIADRSRELVQARAITHSGAWREQETANWIRCLVQDHAREVAQFVESRSPTSFYRALSARLS